MNKSVLVVEDEFDGQQVISEMLAYLDVESTLVSEAEDALFHLESKSYDAILIDLGLPGMDGLMLLRAIRQTHHLDDVPCIVVTAFSSANVKREVFETGGNAFLTKPIDHDVFIREIDYWVKKKV